MHQETVTLFVAWLGICGTLGGIVVGHLLTRSWQREQWLMDRRHEEFQELISALDASMQAEATKWDSSMELTPEERRDKARRISDFFQIARTRIFTANDIKKLDLVQDWTVAVATYRSTTDGHLLNREYSALNQRLIDLAMDSGPKSKR